MAPMTFTKEDARKLIRRLTILGKYPRTEPNGDNPGEDELVEALMEARSYADAQDFVRNWIRNNPKAPLPCDIYQALDHPGVTRVARDFFPKLKPGEEPPPPAYYCNLCEDSGFYMVKGTKEIPDLPGQLYEGAKRCHHPASHRGTKPTWEPR